MGHLKELFNFPGYLPCVHEVYILTNLFVFLLLMSFITGGLSQEL